MMSSPGAVRPELTKLMEKRRWEQIIATGLLLYPVALVGSFWVTWWVAGRALGHAPRPSLDDPKFINDLVSAFHVGTTVLLLLLPGFAVGSLAFGLSALWSRADASRRLLVASSAALLMTGAVLLLRADPYRMVTWFMD
jgi:hypothetical protein